jgi:hypothetical protein
MSGTWDSFDAPPGAQADTMILLTDGSVLVHDSVQGVDPNNRITSGGINWYRLTPSSDGTYKNGHWSGAISMLNARLYFASGVLMDGRVYAVGGEYSDAFDQDKCTLGEIFDPQTNAWTKMKKPSPEFDFITGDCPSCVLADGRVLFGGINGTSFAIWDPPADLWLYAGQGFNPANPDSKTSSSAEETWTLLPDGSVLTVDVGDPNNTQRYDPVQDLWVDAGQTPKSLVIQSISGVNVSEIGPAILMMNGKMLAIGGTGHTAIFDPSAPAASAWSSGPDLPPDPGNSLAPAGLYTVIDGAACLLPGGQVLCVAGKTKALTEMGQTSYWSIPTTFFEFNPASPGTISQLANQPPNNSGYCFECSLLLLPNGQVLYSNQYNQIGIYTPDFKESTPQASWRPTISNFPSTLIIGHAYTLTGTQLNGLSQANSYGDDRQMATNWPLVQVTDSSGNISYLPTSNFSSMGVATGATPQTATVFVPRQTQSGFQLTAGAYTLVVIANGIASTPRSVTLATQDCFFIVDRSTVGRGEVDAMIKLHGPPAVIDDAVYVVVEGFSADDLGGLNAGNASAPPIKPSIPDPLATFSVEFSGPVIAEDFALPSSTIQRFTFPFKFVFLNDSVFAAAPLPVTLNTSLTAAGTTVSSSARIMLLNAPNPYILHGDPAHGDQWYLSVDIRVFQMVADGTTKMFEESIPSSGNPDDLATSFITNVIHNLNNHKPKLGPAFDGLPQLEQPAELTLAPTDGTNPVYNFALARVRFQDLNQDMSNVRLFFRMWAAQQTNATYNTKTLYRSKTNLNGDLIPVFGYEADEIMSIPFFAEKRTDATQFPMTHQTDQPNFQQTITHDPKGGRVDTYFGCWLDINQPDKLIYPSRLIGGNPVNLPDGPYQNMGPLVSIQQLIKSAHQCLIAEISFPGVNIPSNADPSTSDKLAQRNLAFVHVPNPGVASSRIAAQPFEIKPSAIVLKPDRKPDELMIDWGDIPDGSMATFYLPQVAAARTLKWADQLYTTHRLTQVDPHTIQCSTGGVTYIPVPQGAGAAFVGLMTVELPPGIRNGDAFAVVVRQITTEAGYKTTNNIPVQVRSGKQAKLASAVVSPDFVAWRRISGVFRLTILVSNKQALLPQEEKFLSILRWILKGTPVQSRWYPVLNRYVEQVGWLVQGLGGDPELVIATGDGNWKPAREPVISTREFTGKVAGVIYDRFGDFEGFLLLTEAGDERAFRSVESEIEALVRFAWRDRVVITVLTAAHDPLCPFSIILRRAPPQPRRWGP